MNLTHLKCAIEVAKAGSINKASEILLMAPPNLSREIKELETELGTNIFQRTSHGMTLTPEGEEFIGYAQKIITQMDDIKNVFSDNKKKKQHFSISVPRATYISEAFADFSKYITDDYAEIFYNETNSSTVIKNILEADYKLGIVRYAEHHDKYFKNIFKEKELEHELIAEFQYVLVMSQNCPLAGSNEIHFDDLVSMIEIAHADSFVPFLSLASVKKEEHPHGIQKRIYVFERGSQFQLLSKNKNTFMWVSPLPQETLERYNLIQVPCIDNHKMYKDVFVYKKGYSLSELDQKFITELCNAKRKYLDDKRLIKQG